MTGQNNRYVGMVAGGGVGWCTAVTIGGIGSTGGGSVA